MRRAIAVVLAAGLLGLAGVRRRRRRTTCPARRPRPRTGGRAVDERIDDHRRLRRRGPARRDRARGHTRGRGGLPDRPGGASRLADRCTSPSGPGASGRSRSRAQGVTGATPSAIRCSTSAPTSSPTASGACSTSSSPPDGGTLYVHYSLAPSGDSPRRRRTRWWATTVDAGSYRELLAVEQPVPQPQRRRARVRARRLPLHRPRRRRRRRRSRGQRARTRTRCSARSCASTPTTRRAASAYGIPADNPFADGGGGGPRCGSTACATRGASRFDRATGDLWIGDVGQNAVGGDRPAAGRSRGRRGAPTSAGTRWRARIPSRAAATARAACSRCSSTPTTRAARSPAVSSTAARRSRVSAARTCSATTARATCGHCGCATAR